MSWFGEARALVLLRRLVRAQERIAVALERAYPVAPSRARKPVDFGFLDVVEVERRDRARRTELMQDVDDSV